jgi:hypothetical protein
MDLGKHSETERNTNRILPLRPRKSPKRLGHSNRSSKELRQRRHKAKMQIPMQSAKVARARL